MIALFQITIPNNHNIFLFIIEYLLILIMTTNIELHNTNNYIQQIVDSMENTSYLFIQSF